jgi:predicted TIM-barrel fold metal-dependent hydrolase
MEEKPIINCHSHCFTIDHVPNKFAKTMFPLSGLLTVHFIKRYAIAPIVIKLLQNRLVLWILRIFNPNINSSAERLVAFIRFFKKNKECQQNFIDHLRAFYPSGTRFVLLTMDMEFMDAGLPEKLFHEQLEELEAIKKKPEYKDIIYPFVFADPRRPNIETIVTDKLKSGNFNGIKIYPALGYFPFDIRMKEIYQYALKHDLPITTHCIPGSVHYRGSKEKAFNNQTKHPIAGTQELWGKTNYDFTQNFTHPLNFECLLNQELLKRAWGDTAPDLSNLKICLGHFGGEEQWVNYLNNPWVPDSSATKWDKLRDINNPWFDKDADNPDAFSWFSIVCALMKRYKNVYADISYTLSDERILPLLKLLLTSQEYSDISSRILFGTDYFLVEKAGSERELSIRLRSYLGEDLFDKIARDNPEKFLNLSFWKH